MHTRIASLFAAAALLCGTALAHHGFGKEFDEKKPVTLEGVVTRIDWENPHVYFYVNVTESDGAVVNWACETRGPNGLIQPGLEARLHENWRQGRGQRFPGAQRFAHRRRAPRHAGERT